MARQQPCRPLLLREKCYIFQKKKKIISTNNMSQSYIINYFEKFEEEIWKSLSTCIACDLSGGRVFFGQFKSLSTDICGVILT